MRRSPAGYTLIEVLAVIALIAAMTNLAATMLYRTRQVADGARRRIEARRELCLAGERLRQDIQGASQVRTEGGALIIIFGDGRRATWRLNGEVVEREDETGPQPQASPVTELAVIVGQGGFTEVAIHEGSTETGHCVYVAAAPRAQP